MIWKVLFFVRIVMITKATVNLIDVVIAVIAMTKMRCTLSTEVGIAVIALFIAIAVMKECPIVISTIMMN